MCKCSLYVGLMFDGLDPEINKKVSFDIIGGPYDDVSDCISAMYDYEESLRNLCGENGKRTFADEAVDRIVSKLRILDI